MGVVAILLALICLLLVLVLIRYHLAVRDIAQQIRQKRQLVSSSRLAPSVHLASILELTEEVEEAVVFVAAGAAQCHSRRRAGAQRQ